MFGFIRGLAYIAISILIVMAGMFVMITGGPPSQHEVELLKQWLGKVYVATLDEVASGAETLRSDYCAGKGDLPPSDRPCG